MKNKITTLTFGLGLLLAGCSLSPKYEKPTTNLPQSFEVENPKLDMSAMVSQTWWKDFEDEDLDALVKEALENNYDLAVAMERVSQARSMWGYARSDRYPSIGVQGEATRNKKNPQNNKPNNYNNFSLSAVFNYELDLWGRARDADRSAYATLLATKASRDTIMLSLVAGVAESYFALLTINNQVQISQNTLKARTENYEYRKKEYEVGKISEIDMQQAKSEMESVRAQLQSLLMEQNSAQTALMILLGRDPQGIFKVELPTKAKALPKAPIVPVNLPSELLEQRPDIEAAEQDLKAANFSIGVARSAYFPTISLTGMAGYVNPKLNELIKNSSSTWNYGGNFVGNLLDFGRTSANVELSKSQYREMVLNYAQVVRNAFGEVRDSLFNYSMSEQRLKSLKDRVEALRRTLVLAELRYQEGYTNYLEVLNTQEMLFSAELEEQNAMLEHLSSAINVYKSFGGGWDKATYEDRD
ncbi:efflux transporter outer membrane subunit [Helicobacter burdigaliensis]|uniref:efflux transporter outer membrane subunit n=1 Tax=Helicobacter burdigaliensis TaxID=2315334 RepID=UPI000EF6BEF3|nr:efflux transporter outer membrane subunit [Helicobacter burdigaliensis]